MSETVKTQGQILSEIEGLVKQLSTTFAQSTMIVEPLEGGDGAFQIVAREQLTPEGKISGQLEVLREGEVIEQEGRRYRVVKNELGTLYKKSIQVLGQVGRPAPVSIAQFQEQQLQQIQDAFPKGDAGAEFLSVFRDAKTLPTFLDVKGLQPQDIQPLFEKLFTEEARAVLKRVKKTGPYTEMVDGVEQAVLPMYASIRIKNQFDRAHQIQSLIEIFNDECRTGAIRGVQVPLTSIVVPVQTKLEGSFIERLAAPIERFDEIIFIFPWVLVSFHERFMATHDVFRREDELPPE